MDLCGEIVTLTAVIVGYRTERWLPDGIYDVRVGDSNHAIVTGRPESKQQPSIDSTDVIELHEYMKGRRL